MSFRYLIYATVITFVIIFAFVKSVEADITVDTDPELLELATELEDKDMAIMVLGGIDYYVQECTALTTRGVIYRNKILTYHDINESLLPINPLYIKGSIAVSGYDCYEMYELIISFESGVVEQPEHPVDKQQTITEI